MNDQLHELVAELCQVGQDAVQKGLALASGGNLSARVPGSDEFAVTGAGTFLDRLTVDSFAVVDLKDSTAVDSSSTRPSSEWKLHHRTYTARPDVNCIIHLHPQFAVLLDALGHNIRLFTLDHAFYVKSIGRTDFYPNGSDELADTAAAQASEHNCIVMGNHGSSAIGPSIEMAYRRAVNMEQAAEATYRALLLGDTKSEFPRDQWEKLHHA
ncbi:class II aldolase/adducin family protein [Brevibacterium aurantiacum]|uniref:Class II aldolase/adducin family protein n=1 Tax=Brevibacterium aurantiacum TaxID=273384 RepID=A0A556CFE8_BREAU|nr:class II aldolase/adducin family protein [Brevibacterium aurantiacum]TSI16153.1 class II aldolase/adducin family protein [Brevibacterium aurantiacum]